MMKRLFLAAALSLAIAAGGFAQQTGANAPATQADIERYFAVIHMRRTVLGMNKAMLRGMHETIHQEYLKNKERCELPANFEETLDRMLAQDILNMPWNEMIQAVVPVYQKHFTKGDIDAFIAFYSSPPGQKLLRERPALMTDVMRAMMPIMLRQTTAMDRNLEQAMVKIEKQSQVKSCPVRGAAVK